MNKHLKQFFKELQQWIDAGCPEHPVFKNNTAICNSLINYMCFKWPHASQETLMKAQLALHSLLWEQFSLSKFPLNNGSLRMYYEEIETGTIYQNPARLAFIRQHSKS